MAESEQEPLTGSERKRIAATENSQGHFFIFPRQLLFEKFQSFSLPKFDSSFWLFLFLLLLLPLFLYVVIVASNYNLSIAADTTFSQDRPVTFGEPLHTLKPPEVLDPSTTLPPLLSPTRFAKSPAAAPPEANLTVFPENLPEWVKEHFWEDPEESKQRDELSEGCDLWDGKWVYDESYPLWDFKICPFGNDGFNCAMDGRKDMVYSKLRWQPHGCRIPRFNAADFREQMRGRRVALVGDSIGRNQFVSLLCMAAQGANTKKIYERSGGKISRKQQSVVFVFEEFNFTLEYYRSPWLVTNKRAPPELADKVHSVLALDTPDWTWSTKVEKVDILLFNSGHWLSAGKTIKKNTFFSVNETVSFNVSMEEAFTQIMTTVVKWVDQLDGPKPKVYFRSYAPAHFQSGDWNTGGTCLDLVPRRTPSNTSHLFYNPIAKKVIADSKAPITFMNITTLSAFRNDAHIGKMKDLKIFDCSHWCLPGVPDIWNELFYAQMTVDKLFS